ncbi:DUF3465 domain-containing protein [Neptunomonas marina]|uniref:DUF3465 domain-containing protein n=1 Tax=Neptunomonas marina TaxID=1815562 RepID=UPI00197FB804|nr:DUF3465 domain-containing protein [Neptunomonas marina]
MQLNPRTLIALVAVGIVLLSGGKLSDIIGPQSASSSASQPASSSVSSGAVERAFAKRQSDVMVVDRGRVVKLLPDDLKGSKHQKMIVKLASGHTILIAHNIDLAPRLNSLREGDMLAFKGEYEWNERGGVVHWTHHDPRGRHEGGWLELNGKRYE